MNKMGEIFPFLSNSGFTESKRVSCPIGYGVYEERETKLEGIIQSNLSKRETMEKWDIMQV